MAQEVEAAGEGGGGLGGGGLEVADLEVATVEAGTEAEAKEAETEGEATVEAAMAEAETAAEATVAVERGAEATAEAAKAEEKVVETEAEATAAAMVVAKEAAETGIHSAASDTLDEPDDGQRPAGSSRGARHSTPPREGIQYRVRSGCTTRSIPTGWTFRWQQSIHQARHLQLEVNRHTPRTDARWPPCELGRRCTGLRTRLRSRNCAP